MSMIQDISHSLIPLNRLYYLGGDKKRGVMYQPSDGVQFVVRVNTPDQYTLWETWKLKAYDDRNYQIRDTDTIIDIGANIGSFSIWAAMSARRGRIFSYEPDGQSFNQLVRNKNLNHFSHIRCFRVGVCDRPGRRTFYTQPESNNAMSSIFPDKYARKTVISCTSLDQIMQSHRLKSVDLLKIDAEGAEYPILFHASRASLEKVQRIYFEYHDYLHHGYHIADLLAFLRNRGFRLKTSRSFFNLKHFLFNVGFVKAFKT